MAAAATAATKAVVSTVERPRGIKRCSSVDALKMPATLRHKTSLTWAGKRRT